MDKGMKSKDKEGEIMSNEHLHKSATLSFTAALALVGVAALLWLLGWLPQAAFAQEPVGAAFTYQGRLTQNGTPISDTCDFQFGLWDASSGGNQKGVTQTVSSVDVKDGYFSAKLNESNEFGDDAFTGDARWLGIQVQCPGDSGYTDLGRQELTAAPYALFATSTGALHGHPVTTTAPTRDQVLKWDGSTWTPADDDSGGDITEVNAGDGLTGGGVTGAVTVTVAFSGTGTAATVARSDHIHSGSACANVIVVAKSGGDFAFVQAALDSTTDASDTNRYLVWVAPGTYTETVTMKEYMDIEGVGELVTKITYAGSALLDTGTVVGADNAELRFLTVENTGGNTYATAIYNDSASPRLTHVTAIASGGTYNYGVRNYSSSSPTMTNVTASASESGGNYNIGVYNYSSSPTIRSSVISGSGGTNKYGIYNTADSGTYTVTVNSSQITGSTNTIYNDENSDNYTTLVGASLLDGGAVIGTGTITCTGVYDENYTFYANTCP